MNGGGRCSPGSRTRRSGGGGGDRERSPRRALKGDRTMKAVDANSAVIRHALNEKDDAIIAALRTQVAPLKGKMAGPQARPIFDEVMEHTPDAPGVTDEEGAVGGVRGVWCRPQSPRPGVALLYLHGGAYVLGSAHAY